MTYITGTVTSANPSADLYATIATALSSNSYTLSDTVVIGARTHKVWKSPAASNFMNKDWYLDVAYSATGSGSIYFTTFEFFDPATDLGYRGPGGDSSTTIDATTWSRYGAVGYALETNWAPCAASPGIALVCTTASFGYWITITPDRVIGLTSANPTQMPYAGFYTPHPTHLAHVTTDSIPLITMIVYPSGGTGNNSSAQGGAYCGITRVPRMNAAATSWFNIVEITPAYITATLPRIPDGSTSVMGGRYLSPILVKTGSASGANGSGALGSLIDVMYAPAASTVARGDTLTVGADSWIAGTAGSFPSSVFLRAV